MGTLEHIANAAKNYALTYDMAMDGYTHPDGIEADLAVLEDAIAAHRQGEPRAYVYILSDYSEYGADHVVATLDRTTLMDLVDVNWPEVDEWNTKAKAGLAAVLEQDDVTLANRIDGDGWDCHQGWGGMQLHVVALR
jgi:hypothetical protein